LWSGAAAVVVVAVGATLVFNRWEYGVFNPWGAPQRLQYCDAHFYQDTAGGENTMVTKAQAVADADGTLVPHGTTGLFGQWPVFLPSDLKCPQDPVNDQLDGLMFIVIGPDRYVELTDAD
jgi:hypothetical protein